MKTYLISLLPTIALLFLLGVFSGCPGTGTPTITLTVTDCPFDKITITNLTRVSAVQGRQWRMNAKIAVKCDGQPVQGAELKVEFWWPNGTYKLTTNANGEATYNKTGQGDLPIGEKFKVTIKGNDDEKTEEFEIQTGN